MIKVNSFYRSRLRGTLVRVLGYDLTEKHPKITYISHIDGMWRVLVNWEDQFLQEFTPDGIRLV